MSKESHNLSERSDNFSKICEARAAINDEQQENELVSSFAKAKIDEHVDAKSQLPVVDVFHLQSHIIWKIIFQNLSENDVITLSSVCKQFQCIVQNNIIKSDFSLSKNYHLDVNCFLNYALSETCTSIDINYCKWLTPSTINEIISKTNLHHFHVFQSQVNEDCVRAICNLQLRSLSFTYTHEWRSYFMENMHTPLPLFQSLNKLEIEFSQCLYSRLDLNSKTFIFDIYMNVLQHCKELQHFKLEEEPYFNWFLVFNTEPSEFPADSTPLPKLTSLEVVIEQEDCGIDLVNFLQVILKDKIIPIKRFNFGRYTCHLIQDGILFHPLLLHQSRFILRNRYKRYLGDDEDEYFEDYEDKYYEWMGQRIYETFLIDKLNVVDFEPFANRIVSASGESIKQVCIRNCFIHENIVKGIELFAVNCPQITTLHLTIKEYRTGGSYNYDDMVKNENFIKTLTNFKKLKELMISPAFLQCLYTYEDGSQWIKVMPFWNVTQSCPDLNEISLERSDNVRCPKYHSVIHVDSLYAIAHCKNLKGLKMSKFRLFGDELFRMADIIENCARLEQLSIVEIIHEDVYVNNRLVEIFNESRRPDIYDFDICYGDRLERDLFGIMGENDYYYLENFIFEDSLSYTKDLKILRIEFRRRYLTEDFLNSLILCEKLESLFFYLRGPRRLRERDVRHLIEVLPKLKNLVFFRMHTYASDFMFCEPLKTLFGQIKSERPAFSGSLCG